MKIMAKIIAEAIRIAKALINIKAKQAPNKRPIINNINTAKNPSAKLYSLQHLLGQPLSRSSIGQYIHSPPLFVCTPLNEPRYILCKFVRKC